MKPCLASNTFIIQHTVLSQLHSSLSLSLFPRSHPLSFPLFSPVSLSTLHLPPLHALSLSNNRASSSFIRRANLSLISTFLLFSPLSIILFPGARHGISHPYASAPTCNMLAHDKIVCLSASCRERE